MILNQQNICQDGNIILNSNKMDINSQMQEIGNNETAISPIRKREQISSSVAKFRTWQLLMILLLVIGFGILIIFSVLFKQCSNELQRCKETIKKEGLIC